MDRLKLAIITLAIALAAGSCAQPAGTNSGNSGTSTNAAAKPSATTAQSQPPATPSQVSLGKETYAMNCTICHKEDGGGGKVTVDGKEMHPENLTTTKMKNMSDEKLINYVTKGIPDEGMPAFKDKLTEQEIKDVVAHIRSLQGSSITN